jgi:signal transduction histidine kinase
MFDEKGVKTLPADDMSLELFRIAFDHAPDPIIVLDTDGELVMWNREADRWAREACELLFDDESPHAPEIDRFRAQLNADGRAHVETRLDGRSITAVGRTEGAWQVLTLHDVTDVRRQEAELSSARRIESIGHFTASLIHDLNNLLTPIACLSACMEGQFGAQPDAQAVREMARDIRTAAEKAAALARQTLRWVRREPSRVEAIDPCAVIAELEPLIQQVVGAEVRVQLRVADCRGSVLLDREGLEHALLNLAANARDAMPSGGALTLSCTRAFPGQVAISVEDTGIGMNREVKARMLERYFTTKEIGKGTGLGLEAVRAFVRDSGGNLSLHSEEGRGARVSLYFPAADAKDFTPSERTTEPLGSGTILVVDDDDGVRGGMRAVLEAHGYSVVEAATGQHAIRAVLDYSPLIDGVVADVVMPGMSGVELADRLQELRAMPILFMSGHTEQRLQRAGWRESRGPLLRKAFTPSELLRSVRGILGRASPPLSLVKG